MRGPEAAVWAVAMLTLAAGAAAGHNSFDCGGVAPFSSACSADGLSFEGHVALDVELAGFIGEFEARLEQGPLAYVIHCTSVAIPDIGPPGPTQCTTHPVTFVPGRPLALTCRASPLDGQPAPSGTWGCRVVF